MKPAWIIEWEHGPYPTQVTTAATVGDRVAVSTTWGALREVAPDEVYPSRRAALDAIVAWKEVDLAATRRQRDECEP